MSQSGRSIRVIVQTAFLGDLLLAVPLMRKTKTLFPHEDLHLVCRKGLGDFFQKTGLVDQVHEVTKGDASSYARVQKDLQHYSILQVISPHSSFRTALFVRGLSSKRKTAFAGWWKKFFFDETIVRNAKLPDPVRQLQLLSSQDHNLAEDIHQYARSERAYRRDDDGHLSSVPLWAKVSLRAQILGEGEEWIRLSKRLSWTHFEGRPKVLLFPGSVWATKRWTEQGFIESGRRLAEQGAAVIVMGAPNEVEISQRVAAGIPGAVSWAGQTSLFESALVIAHADLVIGNDSASIHLASLCETPLIAVFGPTVIEFGFRPWSDQAWVVDKKGLSCRPCGPHGHHRCPRGTHECMRNLSSQEVSKLAINLLP